MTLTDGSHKTVPREKKLSEKLSGCFGGEGVDYVVGRWSFTESQSFCRNFWRHDRKFIKLSFLWIYNFRKFKGLINGGVGGLFVWRVLLRSIKISFWLKYRISYDCQREMFRQRQSDEQVGTYFRSVKRHRPLSWPTFVVVHKWKELLFESPSIGFGRS